MENKTIKNIKFNEDFYNHYLITELLNLGSQFYQQEFFIDKINLIENEMLIILKEKFGENIILTNKTSPIDFNLLEEEKKKYLINKIFIAQKQLSGKHSFHYSIVDFLFVLKSINRIIAFEIKSDLDKLDRLENQLKNYFQFVDLLYVFCAEKFVEPIKELINKKSKNKKNILFQYDKIGIISLTTLKALKVLDGNSEDEKFDIKFLKEFVIHKEGELLINKENKKILPFESFKDFEIFEKSQIENCCLVISNEELKKFLSKNKKQFDKNLLILKENLMLKDKNEKQMEELLELENIIYSNSQLKTTNKKVQIEKILNYSLEFNNREKIQLFILDYFQNYNFYKNDLKEKFIKEKLNLDLQKINKNIEEDLLFLNQQIIDLINFKTNVIQIKSELKNIEKINLINDKNLNPNSLLIELNNIKNNYQLKVETSDLFIVFIIHGLIEFKNIYNIDWMNLPNIKNKEGYDLLKKINYDFNSLLDLKEKIENVMLILLKFIPINNLINMFLINGVEKFLQNYSINIEKHKMFINKEIDLLISSLENLNKYNKNIMNENNLKLYSQIKDLLNKNNISTIVDLIKLIKI